MTSWSTPEPTKRQRIDRSDNDDSYDYQNIDILSKLNWGDNGRIIRKSYTREYHNLLPRAAPDGQYSFKIDDREHEGTDLQNCYLEVDLQVFKENRQPLTEEDKKKIFPVNDLFNALFSKVSYNLSH